MQLLESSCVAVLIICCDFGKVQSHNFDKMTPKLNSSMLSSIEKATHVAGQRLGGMKTVIKGKSKLHHTPCSTMTIAGDYLTEQPQVKS